MALRLAMVLLAGAALASVAQAEDLEGMMRRCAPQVHPTTLKALMHVESSAHAFAVSDDGPAGLPWETRKTMLRSFYPGSREEAISIAETLVRQGHLVGVGPLQVSVRNVARLGSTLRSAFEPCENIRLGGAVVVENFVAASRRYKNPQQALLAAISLYNTGTYDKGFRNGYVRKVVDAARVNVPGLKTAAVGRKRTVTPGRPAPAARPQSWSERALAARMAKLEVESF